MKILFDQAGQQVHVHLHGAPTRLTPLFSAIEAVGWQHSIATPLTADSLKDRDVLVLTNRVATAYTTSELGAIVDFVRAGGGLWCMANHAAWGAVDQGNNHVRYDSAVSTTFYTSFEATAYTAPQGADVILEQANLPSHRITRGRPGWPALSGSNTEIKRIATRSFCAVHANSFAQPVALLNDVGPVQNTQNGRPPGRTVAWAVALKDAEATGSGRALFCGDAGWLGNEATNMPGRGQFQVADNAQFAINCLAWLARL